MTVLLQKVLYPDVWVAVFACSCGWFWVLKPHEAVRISLIGCWKPGPIFGGYADSVINWPFKCIRVISYRDFKRFTVDLEISALIVRVFKFALHLHFVDNELWVLGNLNAVACCIHPNWGIWDHRIPWHKLATLSRWQHFTSVLRSLKSEKVIQTVAIASTSQRWGRIDGVVKQIGWQICLCQIVFITNRAI